MRFFTTLATLTFTALVACASADSVDSESLSFGEPTLMALETLNTPIIANANKLINENTVDNSALGREDDDSNLSPSVTPRTPTKPSSGATNADDDSFDFDDDTYPTPSVTPSTTTKPSPPSVTPRTTPRSNSYPTPSLTPGTTTRPQPGASYTEDDSFAVDDNDDTYPTPSVSPGTTPSTTPTSRRLRWWF